MFKVAYLKFWDQILLGHMTVEMTIMEMFWQNQLRR